MHFVAGGSLKLLMKNTVHKQVRVLAAGLFVLSCAVSLMFLATRNMYDDEVGSFHFIPKPVAFIWNAANSSDFHPPGMYVLSHFFYELTQSVRWTTVGPLAVLYLGLAVFCAAALRHFAHDKAASVFFCAVALLHPQLLMWGNSIRWYPYWTGIALIFLTIALSLRTPPDREASPPPGWVCALLGVMAAALFYLNYMTLLFLAAFGIAFLVRYGKKNVWRLVVLGAVAALLASPQVTAFLTVHLPKRGMQQYSRFVAAARVFHGTFMSEAVLPWQPVALLFLALVAAPLLFLVLREVIRSAGKPGPRPVWMSLGALFLALLALAALSGLGGKPRSFIVLAPIFAFLLATGFLFVATRYRLAIAALAVCWISVGIYHLLAREGTAKGGMNDRPDEIAKFIAEQSAGQCAIVFLHDPSLSYVLDEAAHNRPWTIVSVYGDPVHSVASGDMNLKCEPSVEFVIQSYTGDQGEVEFKLNQAMQRARDAMVLLGEEKFGRDEDVAYKRSIPGLGALAKSLPEYRFDVTYGYPKQQTEWQSMAAAFRWDKPVSVSGLR